MKLAAAGEKVVRIGHQTEREFKIKATAKAFRILSSGLYKDKIGAILRELSANAYDAHTAGGCPEKPFLVHLPNTMEPYLSIRDYGPGLSHDDILDIYTTYFESTKTNSNDYIGALGLGSKSPFSYVKSFTVVSRFGGVQRTYDAFIDEDGMPSIALRHAMALETEETGLEVIVPVSHHYDFHEFRSKAERTYDYYPVKPTITGSRVNLNDHRGTIAMQGNGWRIFNHDGYRRARPIAVMGIVGYPIDFNALSSATLPQGKGGKWDQREAQAFLNAGVELDFEVGALDITAGREELSYDTPTVIALRERVQAAIEELRAQVSKKFDECKSLKEAKILYGTLFSYGSSLANLWGHNFAVDWNGHKINSDKFNFHLKDYPNMVVRHYTDSYRGGLRHFTSIKYNKDREWESEIKFRASDKQKFVIQDLPDNRYSARIFEYRSNNRNTDVFLIETSDATELDKLKAAMDGYDFDGVSTLPKPAPQAKTRAKVRTLATHKRHQDNVRTCHSTDWWPETEVTVEDGGVYVLTKHCKFQRKDGEEFKDAADEFSETFVAARNLKLFDASSEDVIAVPVTESKAFVTSNEWTDFWTWIGDKASAYIARDANLPEKIALVASYKAFTEIDNHYAIWEGLKTLSNHLPDTHEVNLLVKAIDEASKAPAHITQIETVAKHLGLELPTGNTPNGNLIQRWEALTRKYPLLKYLLGVRYSLDRAPTREIAQYVIDADRINGKRKKERILP